MMTDRHNDMKVNNENVMNKRFISAILISTILGSAIGFSSAYFVLDPQIRNLRAEVSNIKTELEDMSTKVKSIEDTVAELQSRLGSLRSDVESLNSTIRWAIDKFTVHAAALFLYERFDETLHLICESPHVHPDWYWLVSDNLLAQQVLSEYYPDIAKKIRTKLIELADRYGLPTNAEGLPITFKHEAVLGERVPLPFNKTNFYVLETGGGYTIRTEVLNSTERMLDWEEYIDGLCYASLTRHYENKSNEAEDLFNKASEKWDGRGLADKGFKSPTSPSYGRYETYKLALLLFTSKTLGIKLDYEDDLCRRIWACQNQKGGIITHYLPDGTPDPRADANSETTSFVLLARPRAP